MLGVSHTVLRGKEFKSRVALFASFGLACSSQSKGISKSKKSLSLYIYTCFGQHGFKLCPSLSQIQLDFFPPWKVLVGLPRVFVLSWQYAGLPWQRMWQLCLLCRNSSGGGHPACWNPALLFHSFDWFSFHYWFMIFVLYFKGLRLLDGKYKVFYF